MESTTDTIVKENDLVLLRLPNDLQYQGRQRNYSTWFRVLFINNDGTFQGQCERIDDDFITYQSGQIVTLLIDKILRTYNNEQFCYADNVTICDCDGLCRNK